MDRKIKIIHLEDSLKDSELIFSIIEDGGIDFDYFLVDNEKSYLTILKNEKIDLILADYKLPDYNGNEALQVAREKYSQIPFIFISGTIGETAAIDAMLNGAKDYVLKNKLERLVPAIKRALRENEIEIKQKKAEEALRESEVRYRKAQEVGHVGSWEYSIKNNSFWLSDEGKKMCHQNLDANVFTPKEVLKFVVNHNIIIQAFKELTEKDKPFDIEFDIISPDQLGKRTINAIAEVVRNEYGPSIKVTGIIIDITEQKVAEVNLQRKLLIEKVVSTISSRLIVEADFESAIFNSMKELCSYAKARTAFVLIKSRNSIKIAQTYVWNNFGRSYKLYEEYNKFQLLSEWFFKELDGHKELLITDTKKMLPHHKKYQSELQFLGIRSLLLFPIMGQGEVAGCFGLDNTHHPELWEVEEYNFMITLSNLFSSAFHRKSVEQDLLASEEIHHILMNARQEGIIIIDPRGRITEASKIALQIFRSSTKEEMVGKLFLKFMPVESRKLIGGPFSNELQLINNQTLELNLFRIDKSTFIGEINVSLLLEGPEKTEGYLIVIRDISERKKMDKQQIHTEKMAGIGVLAAGMAHEINQPLNTISLSLDNLILTLNSGHPVKGYIENKTTKIFDSIFRIRTIIDHVRAFSRDHDDYVSSGFNINLSILNVQSMLSDEINKNGINLVLNLYEKLPQPLGNSLQFEQVLVNLIINARDAIEEKKTLMVKDFRKVIEISTYKTDFHACLEVKDNGIGIESTDMDKVMLPFFSTKKEGAGTGLGLSISFGIIRDMSGSIEIQSKRLLGTSFLIKIPLVKCLTKQIKKK